MPLVDTIEAVQPHLQYFAHTLLARNTTSNSTSTSSSTNGRPPVYKVIGLSLAIASGLFIGVSFVLKKTGLLKANVKYNEEAGEGYGYLKNAWWWGGMTLMIVGEICNFVAYAFTDAILVTPLGALSVVVTTILSAIFLKERLSFVGKVGCFNCIVGSVVIVMNAPEQSAVADIQEMQHFVIAPGFLSYAGVIIVGCVAIALWVAPRYGKKSMFVYLSICSFIGGLSVVATQGLGAAVVAQASQGHQFTQWFLYVLLVFVVGTLLTEIIYLNKALNLFNAALVTPTYYVFFTSTTIITSAVLFRGFHGTAIQITTVILGFAQICSGVVLLQLSKSAKDVPDAAVFKGDLSQVREVAEQEGAESEPKADAIRGTASIIRRISTPRMKMEQAEVRRYREEKLAEHLEPLKENEVAEWDGLRRRKTVIGQGPMSSPVARRKTIHPPLGMSHFPEDEPEDESQQRDGHRFLDNVRSRTHTILHPKQARRANTDGPGMLNSTDPVALTDMQLPSGKSDSSIQPYGPGSFEEAQARIYGHAVDKNGVPIPSPRSKPLPPYPSTSPGPDGKALGVPGDGNNRAFSFSKFFHRNSRQSDNTDMPTRPSTATSHTQKKAMKNATEEERLGLVQGESNRALLENFSPERTRPYDSELSTYHSHSKSDDFGPSVYDTEYPYTHTQSTHRAHRSASPDAMSDTDDSEDMWQRVAQDPKTPTRLQQPPADFSFSSKGPEVLSTPQHQSASRKRPSPPRIYTPPPQPQVQARDFANPFSPDQGAGQPAPGRRITLSNNDQASSGAAPILQPPVHFPPSQIRGRPEPQRQQSSSSQPRTSPERDRGRPLTSNILTQDVTPENSGDSSRSSKERFRDQSAREREDRRQRAQNRQSMGRGGGNGGEII